MSITDELREYADEAAKRPDYISAPWIPADSIRHHRPPTVTDILREFAEKVIDSQIPDLHPTYEEAIAEYAKLLRLAGEE